MPVTSLSVSDVLAAFTNGTLGAGTHVLDLASNVDGSIDALETVAQAGLLGGIDLTNSGRPAFAVTPAQLTSDAQAIALISGPYFLEQRITAADAATATLTDPFTTFAVVDSATNIIASLASIEALLVAGHLGVVRLTDPGQPILDLSAAQVSAYADVFRRIGKPFSIVLTDPGTPTITLPSSDTVTSVYTNVIAAITTPFTLAWSSYQRSGLVASIESGADRYSSSDFYGALPPNPIAPFGSLNPACCRPESRCLTPMRSCSGTWTACRSLRPRAS